MHRDGKKAGNNRSNGISSKNFESYPYAKILSKIILKVPRDIVLILKVNIHN